jgi:Mg-chelatase subunit ChlD
MAKGDKLGLVTFNKEATIRLPLMEASEAGKRLQEVLEGVAAEGLTSLGAGFGAGVGMLESCEGERRVLMVTDVEDDSFSGQKEFIRAAADKEIFLTIAGIGSDFRADICQAMADTPGYNYFCGASPTDLTKWLV